MIKKFEMDFEPINKDSKFVEFRSYSKAYLRQQFKAKEILASRLATLNNLEFYIQLIHKIREKIANGTF